MVTIILNVSVKKYHVCEEHYVFNPSACSCENGDIL